MRLNVPYIRQINPNACFVASTAMILKYHGMRINQKQIYNRSKEYDPKNKRKIIGCSDAKLVSAIKHTGYSVKEKRKATISLIKSHIKNKMPVAVEVYSKTWFKSKRFSEDETHAVVITGFDSNGFYVNDPYLPYLGKKGNTVKVNSNHFKKSWKSLYIIKM